MNAAAKEFRPRGHRNRRVDGFRQQTSELRVMPAQAVAAAVPMLANAGAKAPNLDPQLLPAHFVEVFVQHALPPWAKQD